jgi:hypothetical protein
MGACGKGVLTVLLGFPCTRLLHTAILTAAGTFCPWNAVSCPSCSDGLQSFTKLELFFFLFGGGLLGQCLVIVSTQEERFFFHFLKTDNTHEMHGMSFGYRIRLHKPEGLPFLGLSRAGLA